MLIVLLVIVISCDQFSVEHWSERWSFFVVDPIVGGIFPRRMLQSRRDGPADSLADSLADYPADGSLRVADSWRQISGMWIYSQLLLCVRVNLPLGALFLARRWATLLCPSCQFFACYCFAWQTIMFRWNTPKATYKGR